MERGKWQQEGEAYLEIDVAELFRLNDSDLFRIVDVLVTPRAFPIESADCYHSILAQNAHKKATEVTRALRDTVRESIEIIANEIIASHERKPLEAWKNRKITDADGRRSCARELRDQAIRYVYRLLFFLFTESQEKESLPTHSPIYQLGYSIEKLRNLENKPLAVSEVRGSASNFIQRTIDKITRIYFQGYGNGHNRNKNDEVMTDAIGFAFPSLGSELFDPEQTPLINEATLSDTSMQQVIQRLSLAKVGAGRQARTCRVHYAGLGINQLGAVYEGLLSLNPEILGEKALVLEQDAKEHAPRIVPFSRRNEIDANLLALNEDEEPITRPKGTFVLTPVGLERKFSASFYTAEVLTRFLAKEAADTLLKDDSSLERMERLKILEPAMGSGAFLNALVDELAPRMAEEYRKRDSKANPGNKVSLEKYKSRAKEHLMRHCVYGVDLNPTAVELARISLWLNCLHEDGNLPFLDFRLRAGNSLVGAWIKRARTTEGFPHFLFPHPASLNPHLTGTILNNKKRPFIDVEDARERVKELKRGYEQFRGNRSATHRLKNLTAKIDQLYEDHCGARSRYQVEISKAKSPIDKRKIYQQFVAENSAYNQLRAMMDLWCSLWFWPHDSLKEVPSSDDYLKAIEFFAETPLAYGPKQKEHLEKSGLEFLLTARSAVQIRTDKFQNIIEVQSQRTLECQGLVCKPLWTEKSESGQ